MAREITLKCDMCGNAMEQVGGKIWISPAVPGKALSYMSAYTHSGDICSDCYLVLSEDKLAKRRPYNKNGGKKAKGGVKSKNKKTTTRQ